VDIRDGLEVSQEGGYFVINLEKGDGAVPLLHIEDIHEQVQTVVEAESAYQCF
jgi:hypothetical protein